MGGGGDSCSQRVQKSFYSIASRGLNHLLFNCGAIFGYSSRQNLILVQPCPYYIAAQLVGGGFNSSPLPSVTLVRSTIQTLSSYLSEVQEWLAGTLNHIDYVKQIFDRAPMYHHHLVQWAAAFFTIIAGSCWTGNGCCILGIMTVIHLWGAADWSLCRNCPALPYFFGWKCMSVLMCFMWEMTFWHYCGIVQLWLMCTGGREHRWSFRSSNVLVGVFVGLWFFEQVQPFPRMQTITRSVRIKFLYACLWFTWAFSNPIYVVYMIYAGTNSLTEWFFSVI